MWGQSLFTLLAQQLDTDYFIGQVVTISVCLPKRLFFGNEMKPVLMV